MREPMHRERDASRREKAPMASSRRIASSDTNAVLSAWGSKLQTLATPVAPESCESPCTGRDATRREKAHRVEKKWRDGRKEGRLCLFPTGAERTSPPVCARAHCLQVPDEAFGQAPLARAPLQSQYAWRAEA